jgi:hypothetical protein
MPIDADDRLRIDDDLEVFFRHGWRRFRGLVWELWVLLFSHGLALRQAV